MEFPTQKKTVIIAVKGLPYTGTLMVANQISEWAKSPVYSLAFLNSILEELYEEGGFRSDRRPSTQEEDERIRRTAFSWLCKAASSQLQHPFTKFKCVVIESLLSSTSELDQLIELSTKYKHQAPSPLIIIETRLRHKHKWEIIFDGKASQDNSKYWFVPRSWVEVEEAIRDYDAKAWDEHYQLVCTRHPGLIKRLVLDPSLDIRPFEIVSMANNTSKTRWSPFRGVIEYLLTDEAAPAVVVYGRWRKEQVERLLSICSGSASGDCTFRYTTIGVDTATCRACEQHVAAREGAYTCVSCGLALHKPCAQFPPVAFYFDVYSSSRRKTPMPFSRLLHGHQHIPKMTLFACNSHNKFSYKCGGCVFETHLKCRLLPTVIDTPHLHPHPLSLQFLPDEDDIYACALCSLSGVNCGYYCVICNSYYHVRCAHSPALLEHEHGGHLHHMNLILPSTRTSNAEDHITFSGDDYLDPDDSWCLSCYKNLNPQAGFYACQDCPDYVAHVICVSPTLKGFSVGV